MQRFVPYTASLIFCLPITVQAINGVYRGTLNNIDIVVELQISPSKSDQLKGRYAVLRSGVDISLHGTRQRAGEWHLHETLQRPIKHQSGLWILKQSGAQLRGIWQPRHSTRYQKIALERIGDAQPLHTAPDDIDQVRGDPYLWHKVNQTFISGNEIRRETAGFYERIEPRSQIAYPRFSQLSDPNALALLNSRMEDLQHLDIARFFFCQSRAMDAVDHRQELRIHFFSTQLLSFGIDESPSCDPRYQTQGHSRWWTLNLLDGSPFDFNAYFLPQAREHFPHDQIRALAKTLTVQHLQRAGQIKKSDNSDDHPCLQPFSLPALEYDLAFAKGGMLFRLKHTPPPGCAAIAVIPFTALQNLLRTDTPFVIAP